MATNGPVTIPLRPARRRRLDLAKFRLKCRKLWHKLHLLSHWHLRQHTPFQAVFVLATHRSGSNLLVDYINGLPGVSSNSEVLCATLPFGVWRQHERPERALNHIAQSFQTLNTPLRGCKLMLDQLASCKLTVESLEAAFPGSKYVILYRQSLAEQFLSMQSAKATNQWVLFDGQERKKPKLHINSKKLCT